MRTSPLQGHYTLLEETPDRLLFTRTPQQRRSLGLAFGALTVILAAVSIYSLLRPRQDVPGFSAFLVFGILSAGSALFVSTSWTEVEFNRLSREIVRRRYVLGKAWQVAAIPFEQVGRVTVQATPGEVENAYAVRIHRQGESSPWVTLWGYTVEHQAAGIRKKILSTLHPSSS